MISKNNTKKQAISTDKTNSKSAHTNKNEVRHKQNYTIEDGKIIIRIPLYLFIITFTIIYFSLSFLSSSIFAQSILYQSIDVSDESLPMTISCDKSIIYTGEQLLINIENATSNTYLKSSNPEIISIEGNKVIGISEGQATIYAIKGENTSNEIIIECIVPLQQIILNKNEIELIIGKTVELTASLIPENSTYKNITWKSSNEKVATINNGLLTGISEGTAIITAINESTNINSTCNVTVKPKQTPKTQNLKSTNNTSSTTPVNQNNKYYINNVPFLNQMKLGYPTGCEAVSATMAAKYAGYNISVETLIANTPTDPLGKRQETQINEKQLEVLNEETGEIEIITTTEEKTIWVAENPFEYFVGHPSRTAASGSYGCYSKPIVSALSKSGVSCTNLSGCSVDTLYNYIKNRKPVIIWCRLNAKDLKT